MRLIEIGYSATSKAAYGRIEINFMRLDGFMHAKMCHLPSLPRLRSILYMQQLNIDQKQSKPNNAQCNRAEMCTNTTSVLLASRLLFCFLFRVTYASRFTINHALLQSNLHKGKCPSVTAPTFAKSASAISLQHLQGNDGKQARVYKYS